MRRAKIARALQKTWLSPQIFIKKLIAFVRVLVIYQGERIFPNGYGKQKKKIHRPLLI
jgi:hypothetical protein